MIHNESQDGKGIVDAFFKWLKDHWRRAIVELEMDITTTEHMVTASEYDGGVKNCQLDVIKLDRTRCGAIEGASKPLVARMAQVLPSHMAEITFGNDGQADQVQESSAKAPFGFTRGIVQKCDKYMRSHPLKLSPTFFTAMVQEMASNGTSTAPAIVPPTPGGGIPTATMPPPPTPQPGSTPLPTVTPATAPPTFPPTATPNSAANTITAPAAGTVLSYTGVMITSTVAPPPGSHDVSDAMDDESNDGDGGGGGGGSMGAAEESEEEEEEESEDDSDHDGAESEDESDHERENKQVKCDVCGRTFRGPFHLQVHHNAPRRCKPTSLPSRIGNQAVQTLATLITNEEVTVYTTAHSDITSVAPAPPDNTPQLDQLLLEQEFKFGWAERPQRGESKGAKYLTPAMSTQLASMYEAGNVNKGEKKSAGQMQAALKVAATSDGPHPRDIHFVPDVSEIAPYIGAESNKQKKKKTEGGGEGGGAVAGGAKRVRQLATVSDVYARELATEHVRQVAQGKVLGSAAAWTWLSATKHTLPHPPDFPVRAAVAREWDRLKGKGAVPTAATTAAAAENSESEDESEDDEVRVSGEK